MLCFLVCCVLVIQLAGAVSPLVPVQYTNSWAVEVAGGEEKANAIAEKHGLINAGKVGSLKDMYHFILNIEGDSRRRLVGKTIDPLPYLTTSLSNEPEVGFVEQQMPRNMVKKYFQPSTQFDPSWQYQWSVNNTGQTGEPTVRLDIDAEPAWIQGYTGTGIVVGVVDDGVEYTHSDLSDNYVARYSYDYFNFDPNPFPDTSSDDHGTAVAGEIVMVRNNRVCGVGVAYDAQLAGLRLLGGSELTDSQEAGALSHNRTNIDIYSNSWGPPDIGTIAKRPGTLTQRALEEGTSVGRNNSGNIFTFAAGNGGENFDSCSADGYASNLYTIGVGSYSQDGSAADYDEKCSSKMVVVYVDNTLNERLQVSTTTTLGRCTNTFSGTSSATPYVSAVIALTLDANPNLSWRDILYLLAYTSNPIPLISQTPDAVTNGAGLRVSHQFGFGAIDAEAMVTRAQRWKNVPQQRRETVYTFLNIRTARNNSPFVRTFTYTGTGQQSLRSLEFVVVTMTLTVGGINEQPLTQSEATNKVISDLQEGRNTGSPYYYQNRVKRGDISATLTSPNGTVSTILFNRPWDITTEDGYDSWPFKTVLHWGENPVGQWTLRVHFNNPSSGSFARIRDVSVDFYGVTEIPAAVQQIPSQCDSACARGCSGTGPKDCDACASGLVRNATTLECIELRDCEPPNTIASGYCYFPSSAIRSAVMHTSVFLIAVLMSFIAM